MIKIVDAFNLSRLNGPFTVQPLAKFSQGATLLQINVLIFPELKERSKFSTGKRSPALRQVCDWFPDQDHQRVPFQRLKPISFIAHGTTEVMPCYVWPINTITRSYISSETPFEVLNVRGSPSTRSRAITRSHDLLFSQPLEKPDD